MNNTALGAENKKEQIINFISEAHEKFYYEKLKEVRYQDVYHKALCYCLGISDDSRIFCNDFRSEDFFDAALYHAGGDFSAKGRGNCSLDWLYRQGDTGDGTAVCSRDGAGVLP